MNPVKRRLIHAGLVVFTLWPAAHIALVKTWDVDPWKLAGWGMYSAPQIPSELRITCFTPDEVGAYPLRTLPEGLESLQTGFLRDRLGLGRLAKPRALGLGLLERYPSIDGVSIEVVRPVLNRSTGVIEETSTTYEYRR